MKISSLSDVYQILDKIESDQITDEEVIELITFNFSPYIWNQIDMGEYRDIESYVIEYLSYRYEYWNDQNDEFPDNVYSWGYIIGGYCFTFGCSGVAGEYWNDDENLSFAE